MTQWLEHRTQNQVLVSAAVLSCLRVRSYQFDSLPFKIHFHKSLQTLNGYVVDR